MILKFNVMFDGSVIVELLKERNIAKSKLYNHLGVPASTLDKIIKTNGNPTAVLLEGIADFFGVSTDRFFRREVYTIVSDSDAFNMVLKELSTARQELGWLKNENEKLKKELIDKKSGGSFTTLAAEHELDYSKKK